MTAAGFILTLLMAARPDAGAADASRAVPFVPDLLGGTLPSSPAHEVATFLAEYQTALQAFDIGFLRAHVIFPLPAEYVVKAGRVRKWRADVKWVRDLVKYRRWLLIPDRFLAAAAADPVGLHVGREKCPSDASPASPPAADVVDWTRGPEAIVVSGSQATVSFLAEPCAPESHVATIELRRGPSGWILQKKKVKLPK